MNADPEQKPVLAARGSVLIDDFCLNTGLDQDTVENLVRAGHLQGWLWTSRAPIRPWSIFEDALPSREALVALGVPVADDYDPLRLRYGPLSDDTKAYLTGTDAGDA